MDLNFWNRDYRLDRMSLKELTVAFFMHHSIQVYLFLALVSIWFSVTRAESALLLLASVIAVMIIYPLAWYLLHRFVLHGKFLYKFPQTAKVWKRIHFDHHRDPHDLKVLFGALHTTLPTIVVVSVPAGYLIGGSAGAGAALAAGLIVTCIYEFCHCIQHLNYTPKNRFLRKMKRLHLQHHFHDENANYGITSFIPDKIFGTFEKEAIGKPQSPTVFNLGYTGDEVKTYPWVARLTEDIDEQTAVEKGIKRRKPKASKA